MYKFLAIPLFLLVSWLAEAAMALPAWLLWTACGLGSRYFAFLPPPWQSVSLPNMLGLILLFAVGRSAASTPSLSMRVDQ